MESGMLREIAHDQLTPKKSNKIESAQDFYERLVDDEDVNLNEIALSTKNYTGADLAALCREAAVNAMENNSEKINSRNFAIGLKKVKPSITKEVETWYDKIKEGASSIIPKEADKTFYG